MDYTVLSGANLRCAILGDINLSKVNLSDAKLEKARLLNNAGISEEMKLDLKERGAIFEESNDNNCLTIMNPVRYTGTNGVSHIFMVRQIKTSLMDWHGRAVKMIL